MTDITTRFRGDAARDLAFKLKLEQPFIRDLEKAFARYLRLFNKLYAETGTFLNAYTLRESLDIIFTKAYNRTVFVFRDNYRTTEKNENREINNKIREDMETYIETRIDGQIAYVINTTNSDLRNKIREIVVQSVQDGKTLDAAEIANIATDDYLKVTKWRSRLIAMVETQNVAEKTKSVEVQSLPPVRQPSKHVWVAILDNRTRPAHAIADGQVRRANEPFTVDGQLLMFPGDTSMGATMDNIANCRCSDRYF